MIHRNSIFALIFLRRKRNSKENIEKEIPKKKSSFEKTPELGHFYFTLFENEKNPVKGH